MLNGAAVLAVSTENSYLYIRNRSEVAKMANLSQLSRTQRQTLDEISALLAVANRLAKERGAKVPVSNILKDYHSGKIIKIRII
jgi:hypothetical protein